MTNEVSEPQRALEAMLGPLMSPGADILAQDQTTICVIRARNPSSK